VGVLWEWRSWLNDAGGATVIVRGNRIHENARANISISKKGDPLVEGNEVWGGHQSGIFIYGEGRGQIKANKVYRNTCVFHCI
jgi:hypothetical protein